MTDQTTNSDYIFDRQRGGGGSDSSEDRWNLPANDRGGSKDAERAEVPGKVQQPPGESDVPPERDRPPKSRLEV
jgi:hypothetical protein